MALNRGKYVGRNRQKISAKVKIGDVLGDHLFLPTINEAMVRYDLVSTVEHKGSQQNCGHYVAHVRSKEGDFYKVDDNRKIVKSSQAEIELSQLFLYRFKPDFESDSEQESDLYV